jgi:hypothetical protein
MWWIIAGVAFANWVFWLYRLSAFRKDRRWEGATFGEPFDINWQIWNPSNYTPDARTVYRLFILSTLAAWTGLLTAAYVTWR